jgi:hypothetical protein
LLHNAAFPLSSAELLALFGTEQPTHQMVESVIVEDSDSSEAAEDFWDSIDRGSDRYISFMRKFSPWKFSLSATLLIDIAQQSARGGECVVAK